MWGTAWVSLWWKGVFFFYEELNTIENLFQLKVYFLLDTYLARIVTTKKEIIFSGSNRQSRSCYLICANCEWVTAISMTTEVVNRQEGRCFVPCVMWPLCCYVTYVMYVTESGRSRVRGLLVAVSFHSLIIYRHHTWTPLCNVWQAQQEMQKIDSSEGAEGQVMSSASKA